MDNFQRRVAEIGLDIFGRKQAPPENAMNGILGTIPNQRGNGKSVHMY